MTCKPPIFKTWFLFSKFSGSPPNTISVPLPAIFVAIVTDPDLPAWAIMSASCSFCRAFNTLWSIFFSFNFCEINSEVSTDIVPTKIGLPCLLTSIIFSTIALYFSSRVKKILSSPSTLIIGRLVGIATVSKP